jgi:sugar O-acyltransferase (sialic acid O-acetyltransferase NeuD family)
MKRLLILGAGGHGRSVSEAVTLGQEFEIVGFLDDGSPKADIAPLLGPIVSLTDHRARADFAIVAIGHNGIREACFDRLQAAGFDLATVIHPRAFVSPSARIDPGCAVMAGAIVGTEAILETGAIVNSGAVVDHHCRMEAFSHLGTHACMAGHSIIGRGAWMQAGSALGYLAQLEPREVLGPAEGRK